MKGRIILENGMCFEGKCFGKIKDTVGEVVFNTGMTGYQEVLTDPSYFGQIVAMTYPLVGNYGVNLEDSQSSGPKVKGFIVREMSTEPSSFRCEMNLDSYMEQNNIIGIEGVDTRQIARTIRDNGTMKGIITTADMSEEEIAMYFHNFSNKAAVENVTSKKIETAGSGRLHVGVLDFGIKSGIIDSFLHRDCRVTIFPAFTNAHEILKHNVDGVFLSNGPGDPADLPTVLENLKILLDSKPVAGICLGMQIMAMALGAETVKMKFGHRGCNHPVKNVVTGKVAITSQNHGYMVKEDTLTDSMEITHININDGTIEGVRHKSLPIFGVQYHPEASPGPRDSNNIFDEFINLFKGEELWH